MLKKLIALLMAMLLTLTCFIACSKDNEEAETVEDTETETETEPVDEEEPPAERVIPERFKLTSATKGVKVLGVRNLSADNYLRLDWSCSGVEFAVDLKEGNIRFNFTTVGSCNLRIWVDGEEYTKNDNPYFVVSSTYNQITLNDIEAGKHVIKLVKVNDYLMSRITLDAVTFAGSLLEEEIGSENNRYIEFIGEDLTAGLGNIGEHGTTFESQDGTLTYAYMLAEAVKADYSITAMPGQGLLAGNPGVANAYKYASPSVDTETEYSFARKADLVVVDVGTNDFAKEINEAEFKAAYLELLETIREKNGAACNILCIYNAVNDTHKNAILAACSEFGGEAEGVYTFELTRAVGATPTAEEQAAYANALKTKVEELSVPFTPTFGAVSSGDGDKDFIDWNTANS